VLDGDNVRLELNAANQVVAVNTVSGLDQLLVRDTASGSYFVHRDGLGSTTAVTDSDGNMVERYRYSAFGQISVLNADFTPKLGNTPVIPETYTGREWDAEAGLYFYRARYYSPTMGRFISQDPIGLKAGQNYYAYCANNPLNATDPSGQFIWVIVGAAIGGGVDLGLQLWHNGGDIHNVNWVNVGVSAAMGATGVGVGEAIGASVARTALSTAGKVAARAVLNAVSGAAIGATGQVTKNYLNGECLSQNVLNSTAWGAGLGFGGSLLADGVSAGYQSLRNALRGGMCFAAGTKISTPHGEVNIEDIKIGDLVYAYDFKSGLRVERRVTETPKNFTHFWVEVRIGQESIKATRGHRFWIENEKRWIEAADLKVGMQVRTVDGQIDAISDVAIRPLSQPEPTYNLVVETDHDYFIGRFHVLVHNGFPDPSDVPPASGSFDNDHRYSQTRFPELRNDKSLQTPLDSTMNRGWRAQQQAELIAEEKAMFEAGMSKEDIAKATAGEWENLAKSVDAYPSGELTTGEYSGVAEGVPCD